MEDTSDSLLHVAVRLGRLKKVKEILDQQSVDINQCNSRHETPLHLACAMKCTDIVMLLIAFGADAFIYDCSNVTAFQRGSVNLMNKLLYQNDVWIKGQTLTDGDGPLHVAVRLGELQRIQRMLEQPSLESNINSVNASHETPLHLACVLGYENIVHLLVSHGANRNHYNNVPIHGAIAKGHVGIVNSLITENACDPSIRGYQGRTLLHYACSIGNTELVNILILKFGISPAVNDSVNVSPLHIAALYDCVEVASLLIAKYNCPVDCRNSNNETPLHFACYRGCLDVIRRLVVDHNADLNARNNQKCTPLHIAARGGHVNVVIMLIKEFKYAPNDSEGINILQCACDGGNAELAEMLMTEFNLDKQIATDEDASIYEEATRLIVSKYHRALSYKRKQNRTPLHFEDHMEEEHLLAAMEGHTDTVRTLIAEYGCNPQARGSNNRTLLHYACIGGHVKLVEMLIANFNLDPLAVDDDGNSSLHLAAQFGQDNVIRLLITKYKCLVDCRNYDKQTPLHYACAKGHQKIIWMLVSEFKASLSDYDSFNNTPLHLAALKGQTSVLQSFQTTSYIASRGFKGRNILHYACNGGHVELVQLLISDFKVDPLSADEDGNISLHIAVICDNESMVQLLVNKLECPIDFVNRFGQTSLHLACSEGNIDLCGTLILKFNADHNAHDENNDSPLNVAIKHGHTKAVHILASKYDCKPNIKGCELKPLLHQVAGGGYVTMLQELITTFDYDPASIDEDGDTLLHVAAQCGKEEMVELLIKEYSNYCPIGCKNSQGQTPFHCACIGGHIIVAEMLISSKMNIMLKNDDEILLMKERIIGDIVYHTILQMYGFNMRKLDSVLPDDICRYGSVEFLDMLVADCGPFLLSLRDDCKNTLLHTAIMYNHEEIARALIIGHSFPVNYQNSKNQTPLHFVCSRNPTNSLLQLLAPNANFSLRDNYDDQPIHVAAQSGCTGFVITLILDYGCDPSARGFKNRTLLHQALAEGHTSTAKALIDLFHVSVNSTDSDGNTPLHLSSLGSKHESVRMLLYDYHASVSVRNKAGKLALNLAKEESIRDIFKRYNMISENKSMQEEYKELERLSSCKFSGQQKIVRIFVLGNAGSGKSTLIESLKRKWFSSLLLVPADDVSPHTAGIVPSLYESKKTGRLLYYDFAGDREYYSSHAAILEMVSHSNIGNSIYFIVADLTKDNKKEKNDQTLCYEIGYWLSFISYHAKVIDSQHKLKVIVVLSHSDLLGSSTSASKLNYVKMYLLNHLDQPKKQVVDIVDVISSDCRNPRSSSTINVSVQQTVKGSAPYSLSYEAILLHGILEKDFKGVVTCEFQDILSHITDTDINLPNSSSTLYAILKELHDSGLLMIVRDLQGQFERFQLLLNLKALTNEVHMKLFSSSSVQKDTNPHYIRMGIIPDKTLSEILPEYITKECLIQLQYCQEFTHVEVGLDYSLMHDEVSCELLLYFPALCRLDSEQGGWPYDSNLTFSIGSYVTCTGMFDYFPPRFMHVLLLRLAFTFALPITSCQLLDSSDQMQDNQHCTMWKNGIHWLMSEGVECIVEIVNESKGVVAVVKSREKHAYECVRMLTLIIDQIINAKAEFCHSVSLEFFIMDSDDPSSFSNANTLYETKKIKHSLENTDHNVVFSASGHNTLDLERVKRTITCHTYWGELQ